MKFDETPGIAGVYLQIVRETREYYVGESKDIAKRRKEYASAERGHGGCRSQPKLRNKLRSRFVDPDGPQFEFWLLESGLHDTKERKSREVYWDRHFSRLGYSRLNTAPTGGASPMESAECRARLADAMRTPETRAKLSKVRRGRKFTTETRAKLSNAQRNRTAEHSAKISEANRGKRRTADIRAKMSEARRGERNHNFGKKRTAETRAKISEAMRNSWAARKAKSGVAQTKAECIGSVSAVA